MEDNTKRWSGDDHNNVERVEVSDDALSHHHHHHQEAIVQEQNRALSVDSHRESLLFPKTTEIAATTSTKKHQSLSLDLGLYDLLHGKKFERGCAGSDGSLHRNRLGEEQKSALSDGALKGYLLPKTSETTTKNNTKKRPAPVDLFMDRFRRQKVERGCHDQCGFKLFGCDETCTHTNNNIVERGKIAPPQILMNMPPSTSSAQNNNQERENTETKTKHHIKLIIKQRKQLITPRLPRVIANDIISKGGSEIQHVGTKKLMETDVARHQNRLNVINPDALMNALTPLEREMVTGAQSKGLEVEVMEATGTKYSMNIRRRTCNGAAVINGKWGTLVSDKRLSRGDVVQLWGYRRSDGAFSLVLIDAINGENWFCERCGIKLFGVYILLRNCNHQNDDLAVNERGKGVQIWHSFFVKRLVVSR